MARTDPRKLRELWHEASDVCRDAPWGFLGNSEGHALFYLARDYYRGDGAIVDCGSFVGRSAYYLARGLEANPNVKLAADAAPIHCFDNFLVNEEKTRSSLRQQFGTELAIGDSTRAIFDDAVRPVARWLTVHEADFNTCSWSGEPVEILFVDIAKTPQLNSRVIELMFPRLIAGTSIVIQQDYHHGHLPHIHVAMEYLHEYLEVIDSKADDSVVFLNTRPIPDDIVAQAARLDDELPAKDKLALMDRAIERFPEDQRARLDLARATLIGKLDGPAAMQDCLGGVDARYAHLAEDPIWVSDRADVEKTLRVIRLVFAWKQVDAGRFDEALELAETVEPHEEHYAEAQRLRSRCLRQMGRLEEALAAMTAATRDAPADPRSLIELAWLELECNRPEQAVSTAASARDCPPHDLLFAALDVLSLSLSACGRHQEAVTAGRTAVAQRPDDPSLHVHLAWCFRRAGAAEDARLAARAALELDEGNVEATAVLRELGD